VQFVFLQLVGAKKKEKKEKFATESMNERAMFAPQ
jgi:hypothetical protein